MAIMQFEEKTVETLKVGEFALFTKTVSETDITLYAGISADFAPVHMNEPFGRETRFGGRVAHPMLIGAMAGGAIFRLLSPGAYPIKREFQMEAPVYPGDTVTIRAEVAAVDQQSKRVSVEFEAYNQKRELVLRGVSLEGMDLAAEKSKGGQC
ncbi:MAG: MaoC family dehydratase [Lachnospiraceae bacterium]|jgi:3-hydroxybutyryl-CoA dehydratase|nr:MaoC family dehydratase [Lachnospiraceae bacterium]